MNTFNEMVAKIAAQVRSSNIIEVEDIPNIDLYMDQVTTFMDKCLAQYKRYDDDKILTKTMINNYTKAKIFPAPVKKKYSRTHLMLLIMIYHLKSVLSIKDIGVLFQSALTEPNKLKQERMIESIYKGFVSLQKQTIIYLAGAAEGQPDESFYGKESILLYDDDETKRIMMTLALAIRANTEKQLAEKVLDLYL
ncbi:MAG: DUF1836 domain-containing protein [Anaerotignum sp.]|nr:DUF1836 domain-containing protein [Anaerotignum sp.]MBR2061710.1 DUF1836 domain-containing protein [Anaerotignum sp.]MBR2852129.1 DUF1836 domain-containing protein [Anaerotignum sp.]MBR3993596.1 DUF1836 domain-containing protein [Anaerotignum sp.]MBR4113605.1 DUF1836 domain-containing protein [Anaerotignum sp.]